MRSRLHRPRTGKPLLRLGLACLALAGCGTEPDVADRGIIVTLAITDVPCPLVGPCGQRGNPFGYRFQVDNSPAQPISSEGVGEVHAAYADGEHEVRLIGVQSPCTDPGPQVVTFRPFVIEMRGAAFIVYCPSSSLQRW